MKTDNIQLVLILLGALALFSCQPQSEKEIYIIPQPEKIEMHENSFELTGSTQIVLGSSFDASKNIASYLKEMIKNTCNVDLTVVKAESEKRDAIVLQIGKGFSNKEAYEIEVSNNCIFITAGENSGLFYGVQTFRQILLQSDKIKDGNYLVPPVNIVDAPRFSWRGLHLDVSRHMFSVDFIKKYIDYMAHNKLNVFHWHLTDGPGWRIPIDAYPKLTEEGAWRVDKTDKDWNWRETEMGKPTDGRPAYGGYYTKDEIREIIQYASDRFILVIPEIEMPGHSLPPLLSYPELVCENNNIKVEGLRGKDVVCAGSDFTYEFFKKVLDETMELFPSKLIHIGGDEVGKMSWEACGRCQHLIKKEGLKDEKELQSYFITRMAEYVESKGREVIGWDEIMEGGLPENAKVMSWRGMDGGIKSANLGHDVVMAPITHTYFDLYQGDPAQEPLAYGKLYLSDVYKFDPVPAEIEPSKQHHILGGHACLWTEHVRTPEHAEYMLFPRLFAFSETVWSSKSNLNFDYFIDKIEFNFNLLNKAGINYSKSAYNVAISSKTDSISNEITVSMNNELKRHNIRYTLDGSSPSKKSPLYTEPIKPKNNMHIKAATFKNGAMFGRVAEVDIKDSF